MGLASAKITLANPRLDGLAPLQIEALADGGAVFLGIPEQISNQLKLEVDSEKEVTTADGARRFCKYVGSVHIRYETAVAASAQWSLATRFFWVQIRWKTWTSWSCLKNSALP